MEPAPRSLPAGMPLAEAAEALARSPHGILPVTSSDGTYLGTASARTAAETLADGAHQDAAVYSIVHLPPPVGAGTDLSDALDLLVGAEGSGLPVLDEEHEHLVGWITHQTVLSTLHRGPRPAPVT